MVIIKKYPFIAFIKAHADSSIPLQEWYHSVKSASWKNHADLKAHYPSADFIGNGRYVFNIKGNKYRLIAFVHFKIRTVFIKFIGTHAEYDKIDPKTIEQIDY
ncbi:MAG: type II toxin-antitoxin system HigB family toxin [Chloroherpetonaceae bacterium]|nr:type II toxin-antitoxin system HigB family toxin [Chloroherpetonaceae bacterium]